MEASVKPAPVVPNPDDVVTLSMNRYEASVLMGLTGR